MIKELIGFHSVFKKGEQKPLANKMAKFSQEKGLLIFSNSVIIIIKKFQILSVIC